MDKPVIVINGIIYCGYSYINIVYEFGALPSSFIACFYNNGSQLPKVLDDYELRINNIVIQKGKILYCEALRTAGANTQKLMVIKGLDNTHFILKQFCGQVGIQEKISLVDYANKLLKGLPVKIINKQGSITIDRIKCRPNETVFSVLSREVRRLGLVMYTDGINCIIDKEGFGKKFNNSIYDVNGKGNAIKTSLVQDYTNSYDNFISTTYNYDTATTYNQTRPNQILNGLQYFSYQNTSTKPEELKNNLLWQLNSNLANEVIYRATIPTHLINSELPFIGDYIFIEDNYCKVKGLMLIYKTRFYVEDNNNYLELVLKEPDIYKNNKNKSSQAKNLQIGD